MLKMFLMLIAFGCTRARLPFPTPKALRSEPRVGRVFAAYRRCGTGNLSAAG